VKRPLPAGVSCIERCLARDRGIHDDDAVGVNSEEEAGGGDVTLGACLSGTGVTVCALGGLKVFIMV
jgi:hypothetical protein